MQFFKNEFYKKIKYLINSVESILDRYNFNELLLETIKEKVG